MTRCQMRVSAFRLYIYISLPHPHTHTHTLQDIYACAHPRTYILMKHKTLFQVTLSTRALILLYSLNPENLILKCITFTAWKQAAKDPNNLTAVPPGSPFFLFWNRPRVSKAFVFKSRCNKKSCLGATEKKKRQRRVAIHMLLCDVALKKGLLGDWWVIRAEGGEGWWEPAEIRRLTEGRWCPLQ